MGREKGEGLKAEGELSAVDGLLDEFAGEGWYGFEMALLSVETRGSLRLVWGFWGAEDDETLVENEFDLGREMKMKSMKVHIMLAEQEISS